MEVIGKIKQIDETKTYGSNGFKKREVVITTEEQYPQHLLIEFIQDKCNLLDSYSQGQRVKIGINLRGREWQNQNGEIKYFNSINGWRIEILISSRYNTILGSGLHQIKKSSLSNHGKIPFLYANNTRSGLKSPPTATIPSGLDK